MGDSSYRSSVTCYTVTCYNSGMRGGQKGILEPIGVWYTVSNRNEQPLQNEFCDIRSRKDMSLQIIKHELNRLCRDVQDDLPADVEDRVRAVRKMVIKSDQWLEKTAHFQVRILTALWYALSPKAPHSDIMWHINVADGLIDEAIVTTNEEWKKGIPKPLKPAFASGDDLEEETDLWIESYLEDGDFISNEELTVIYQEWMHKEGLEPLASSSLGKRLKTAGFENVLKRADGKVRRGWMISIKE